MVSSFDFTLPAPSAALIAHWRGQLERATTGARLVALAGLALVAQELLRLVASEGATAGVVSAATVGVGVAGIVLAYRAALRHRAELGELRFFGLAPERILEAFLLTTDTRRYAAEVVAQNRYVTIAELNLLALYALELGHFLRSLPSDMKVPMAQHIGFHPDIHFDWK